MIRVTIVIAEVISGQSHNFALIYIINPSGAPTIHHHILAQKPFYTSYNILDHRIIDDNTDDEDAHDDNDEDGDHDHDDHDHGHDHDEAHLMTTSSPAVASLERSHLVITGATGY